MGDKSNITRCLLLPYVRHMGLDKIRKKKKEKKKKDLSYSLPHKWIMRSGFERNSIALVRVYYPIFYHNHIIITTTHIFCSCTKSFPVADVRITCLNPLDFLPTKYRKPNNTVNSIFQLQSQLQPSIMNNSVYQRERMQV